MKLMVLDGNSILNRSYYGIRPLTTKDGFYTQAIYGFLVTMARLEDEERPDAVCVTFDRREPTFRHLEYEGYKTISSAPSRANARRRAGTAWQRRVTRIRFSSSRSTRPSSSSPPAWGRPPRSA